MHYIRLLRPPQVEARSPPTVRLVLTITTDLGDSFLCPPQPLELCILAASGPEASPINLTQRAPPKWKTGMRVLKLNVPLPRQAVATLCVRPLSRIVAALSTADLLDANRVEGLVLPVYTDLPTTTSSTPFSLLAPRLDTARGGLHRSSVSADSHVAFRSIRLAAVSVDAPQVAPLQVAEDLGESIARHIWDAGLAGVALLAELCFGDAADVDVMPLLRGLLRRRDSKPLAVLELGCGVGILGCGLAHLLNAPHPLGRDAGAAVLLTDLCEAAARARDNIARFDKGVAVEDDEDELDGNRDSRPASTARKKLARQQAGGVSLSFESLDWEKCGEGRFGDGVGARAWDLVVLSDCVYNSDTLSPLVRALTALHVHSSGVAASPAFGGTKVFLIQKPRHHSENILFGLMGDGGWAIEERMTMPLAVLGGELQRVEAYLWSRS